MQVARVEARDVPVEVRAPVDLRPLIQSDVGSKTLGYLDVGVLDDVRGVHARGHEPTVATEPGQRAFGASGVVVRDHDLLEEVAPCRNRHHGAADATRADQQDAHREPLLFEVSAPCAIRSGR